MTLDVLEWPRADRPQLRAQREVRVDSVGRFQIDSVPVGRHAVRILAFDYERQIDTLEVVANQVTLLDAVMAPAAFFQDPMDRERLRSATWQPQLQFAASTLGLRACPEAPLEARLSAQTLEVQDCLTLPYCCFELQAHAQRYGDLVLVDIVPLGPSRRLDAVQAERFRLTLTLHEHAQYRVVIRTSVIGRRFEGDHAAAYDVDTRHGRLTRTDALR